MPRALNFADPRLAAVILAAGGSTRLGRPKQLLRFRGQPLLVNCIRLARRSAGAGVIVVLGDGQLRLRGLLRRRAGDVVVVRNTRWREGLATSLRAGTSAVPRAATAALILVVDQPHLSTGELAKLTARWRRRPHRPVAATYLGRPGVPAVLPRGWFRAVADLEGDMGARQLLRRIDDLAVVEIPSAAFDVDTPLDAAALGL